MSQTIAVADDRRYILAVHAGVINRQVASRLNAKVFALGREEGISRYLFDLRQASNNESIMDQYAFAYEDMRRDDEILKRGGRIAVVIAAEDRSHDFIETVVRNSGVDIKFFNDIDSAKAYLER